MSSMRASHESSTELRLDYEDIASGQLVIVIHGLPTDDRAKASKGNLGSRSTPSPLVDEAEAIIRATGHAPPLFTPLLLAAWRGQEALAVELAAATIEEAGAEHTGWTIALTEYAKAVLYNGLGRYHDAVAAARRACAHEDIGLCSWARLELIEAGARDDARAAAAGAVRSLGERTREGSDWVLGAWCRSAALLSNTDAAETLFREAIERFHRGGVAVHLPRAQLVYGEWLRRQNRRVEARESLRAARDALRDIGADAFAERAHRELLATGETARRRTDDTRDVLTPQEAQIARLARDGLTNPEIGAQLFISARTVQYHLRKVFRKLDIHSRNQLGRVDLSRLSPGDLGCATSEATGAAADARQLTPDDSRTHSNGSDPIRKDRW
jgi:DNA-binding CsgD family transcriptional regulator